jgi:hypothetical protein
MNANTLTITASAGNYDGLTVNGGTSSDSIVLNVNGAATFAGQPGTAPVSSPNSLASHSGIAIMSSDAPDLNISCSGPLTVKAVDNQAPSNLGSTLGYPGIATNGNIEINAPVSAYGSNENGPGYTAGCGIYTPSSLSTNIWGDGLKAYGGSNPNGSGGSGIDVYGTVNFNGIVTAVGGDGQNGGPGIVAYDYPAIIAGTAVDTAIKVTGGTVNATGGAGSTGSGGAGVLTPFSMSVNNGASVSGTGGNGVTYGGTGIAVATPISGVVLSPDPGNSLTSDNGGAIVGKGGNAIAGGGGYGGAGLETSILSVTGGAGITGSGGDGDGSNIGGPGVLASSDISVNGISTSTGATLAGEGGEGGSVNGAGGNGITTNAIISASNGASLTGEGGEGHGLGVGGDGVSSGAKLDASGGAQVQGTGGAATGTGTGGGGVVTGVIRDPVTGQVTPTTNTDSSVTGNGGAVSGTGGDSAGGSGGSGITVGGDNSAPAISAINGTRIVGKGGKGGVHVAVYRGIVNIRHIVERS